MTSSVELGLSRRHLFRTSLGLGAGLGAATLLGACGTDQADPASGGSGAAGGGGPWKFTDDVGATIELDERPTRIVGLTDIVASLWNYGVLAKATFGSVRMKDDSMFEGKDISKVVELGKTFGEINLEKLASLRPQLVISLVYSKDPKEVPFGIKDKAQLDKIKKIAPVATIAMVGSAEQVLARVAKLARSLGGDTDSERVRKARQQIRAASDKLTAAAERDVKTLIIAGYPDKAWIPKAPDDPYLTYYRELGANLVVPKGKEYYWKELSWENIDQYPADVLLLSQRADPVEKFADIPTYRALPAVRADQVHTWDYTSPDYVSVGRFLTKLGNWLDASRKLT